jgi:hypothetical protein
MRGLNFPLTPALQNALLSEWPKISDHLYTVLGAIELRVVSEESRTGLPMLKLFFGVAHVVLFKIKEQAGRDSDEATSPSAVMSRHLQYGRCAVSARPSSPHGATPGAECPAIRTHLN